MKTFTMGIFFTLFFSVFFFLNYYIFKHGWDALPRVSWMRITYLILFVYLASAYIISRILDRTMGDNALVNILTWTGSFWFAALLYFFIAVVLVDLARLVNLAIPWYPAWIKENYELFKTYLLSGTVLFVILLIIAGTINARMPVLRKVIIQIDKPAPVKQLTIAMASDIHFGTMLRTAKLEKLVSMMNGAKPDLIALVGDLMEEQRPWIKQDLGAPLRNLNAPLGVFAVTGNHEYINGAERAVQYFETLGIKVLRDTVIYPANWFVLVGREDKDMTRHGGKGRKSLEQLLQQADRSLPVIVLDHQPLKLQEAVDAWVDLQLSGHTHDGQMWPFNYLIDRIYEVSHGYFRKENFQLYVSNGFGTWGPPVRIGNRPEVVLLTVRFKE
ncbi:MAG: metallophosphoesterase [Bacteroidales bacterium]